MEDGKKDGPYDLIIIADGRESIRKNMKHVKSYEKKWGTPIYIQLAIIKMESDFDWLAKPARQKNL